MTEPAGATIAAAILVDGSADQALLEVARERSADLIVLGARRHASMAERLLGSVATEVLRQADCDVLVVRPAGVEEGRSDGRPSGA